MRTRAFSLSLVAGTALFCTTALLSAQTAPAAQNTMPQRTVWQGVYTAEQAAQGSTDYNAHCQRCHAVDNDGVPTRFVAGGYFWRQWGADNLSSMFAYISRWMPNNQPASLTESQYLNITAFLLASNGLPAGNTPLTAADTHGIRVVTRDGNDQIPAGALVLVAGCLSGSGSQWSITEASNPVRARESDTAGDVKHAAAVAAAGHTYPLRYLMLSPARYQGQKVAVRGLMMRNPDALNVTTISPLNVPCG